jgi:mono/diheme cytochrome c family protein
MNLFRIVAPLAVFTGLSLNASAQASKSSANEQGKIVYETNCLACHQADGSGVPQLTPGLANTDYIKGDKTRLINVVLKGLQGVEVEGEMYDNPMPPFDFLSDEEVAAVLTYVRSNFSNKASAVKKEEVAQARKAK